MTKLKKIKLGVFHVCLSYDYVIGYMLHFICSFLAILVVDQFQSSKSPSPDGFGSFTAWTNWFPLGVGKKWKKISIISASSNLKHYSIHRGLSQSHDLDLQTVCIPVAEFCGGCLAFSWRHRTTHHFGSQLIHHLGQGQRCGPADSCLQGLVH